MTQFGAFACLLRLCLALVALGLSPSVVPLSTPLDPLGSEIAHAAPSDMVGGDRCTTSTSSRVGQQFEESLGDDEGACLPAFVADLCRQNVSIAGLCMGWEPGGPPSRELPGFPNRLTGRHPPARAPPAWWLVS